MEIIERKSRKKKTDKEVEKILAAIARELPGLDREDSKWPSDHVHAISLCNLRVVIASHARDMETSRKELLKAAATIVRCLKGYETKTAVPAERPAVQKKEPAKKTVVKEAEGYFNCLRSGQRISETVCIARREQKKRGCVSCKTGKELEKKLKTKK
jgi:hypothetical protein